MPTASDTQRIEHSLDKRLFKLQGESALVQSVVAKTNQLEYENLSSIYIWWRSAASIDGYLEKVLKATAQRRVFNEATGGVNFKRLLYLMYGNYGLFKDSLERKNRVICKLHEEYEKNSQLYAKDGVNKLAGFIKAQGGVDGLINTDNKTSGNKSAYSSQPHRAAVPSPDSTSTDNTQAEFNQAPATQQRHNQSTQKYTSRIEVVITDAMRQSALLNEATEYFSKNINQSQVSISPPISTNKDGYALALVKKNGNGYEVIGATDNNSAIRDLLVTAYRKQYAAMPYAMRCFLEIIKTQSLPSNLQKLYDKLTELSVQKHDDKTRKKIQRRVIYLASENTLVLSPTFSNSGVVTLARLKAVPFEGNVQDCFMPTRCRKIVEQRMLSTHDFNLFSTTSPLQVPEYNYADLASHMLRLDNKAERGDFVFIEFWAFEKSMGQAVEQLYFAHSYADRCPIKFKLCQHDLQTLAYEHINKWLSSYGDHITRPANQLIALSIDNAGFELGFDFVNEDFRNHVTCAFSNAIEQPIEYSATFLSKDLCLALHSIGDLPIIGDVEIACSSEVIIFTFATEVADYTIAVPTTTGTKRNEAAFCVYAASTSTSSKFASPTENDLYEDYILETTVNQSNMLLTDDAIDKMLGDQVDDYAEILEGLLQQAHDEFDDVEWTTSSE